MRLTIPAVLFAAALPAVALASRAPSHAERKQLRNAVTGSKLVQRSVKGHFTLIRPRVATADVGQGRDRPVQRYSDPFNAPKGLFKHRSGGWKLV